MLLLGQCDLKKWLSGGSDGALAVVHGVYRGLCGGKKVYEIHIHIMNTHTNPHKVVAWAKNTFVTR